MDGPHRTIYTVLIFSRALAVYSASQARKTSKGTKSTLSFPRKQKSRHQHKIVYAPPQNIKKTTTHNKLPQLCKFGKLIDLNSYSYMCISSATVRYRRIQSYAVDVSRASTQLQYPLHLYHPYILLAMKLKKPRETTK